MSSSSGVLISATAGETDEDFARRLQSQEMGIGFLGTPRPGNVAASTPLMVRSRYIVLAILKYELSYRLKGKAKILL